jgi:hypothetical protein
MTEQEQVSRRDFVKLAGAAICGIAVGAVGEYALMPTKAEIVTKEVTKEVPQEVPPYPWAYTKLDPDAVAKRGYDAYFKGGCCYGVFEAIVGELKDQVGFPFTTIPTEMANFGKGGAMGWGTLCGCLNGAGMAINLVSDNLAPVSEVMGYYTETAFPIYVPATAIKVDGVLTSSVSNSPLCHASVTKWCDAAGKAANSPDRAERCARLVADVAKKTVELLNNVADGTFQATYAAPQDVIDCLACHGTSGDVNNVITQMDCADCHGSPHSPS